jgi:predicted transcriptional regulator
MKMATSMIEQIVSSKTRLNMANLMSRRARTLAELSALIGISVQAVLKHANKLRSLGILGELELRGAKYLGYRKLYSVSGARVQHYDVGNTIVASVDKERGRYPSAGSNSFDEIEIAAEDLVITTRRVREQVKRTARLLEELSENQSRLDSIIDSFGLDDEEKLISSIIFTEDSNEAAEEILREYYGCKNPQDAIAATVAKMKKLSKID